MMNRHRLRTRPGAWLLLPVVLGGMASSMEADQVCTNLGAGACKAPQTMAADETSSWSGLVTGLVTGIADRVDPGDNQVPLSYVTDMLKLLGEDFSWSGAYCDGVVKDCKDKENFPGPNALSQIGYERVKKLISQMPSKEWSGEWWRGNELGTLIDNPFFYYMPDKQNRSRLSPMAIALGISPKQHAVIRPIFERAFTINHSNQKKIAAYVEKTADELLDKVKQRGVLQHNDLKLWFQRVANYMAFGREVDDAYNQKFIEVQGSFLALQTVSQAIPSVVASDMEGTRARVIEFVEEYKTLLQKQYADLLEGQDCSPSLSCADQAAFGMFDTFVAAGGVSVPGTILQALSVVFSTHESNPAGRALGDYSPDEAGKLIWEAIRIFPPVVVFPYWNPRPTCPGLDAAQTAELNMPHGQTVPCPLGAPDGPRGYPTVNQYTGGKRFLPNVAMAQRAPEIWGDDAQVFRLRDLDLYDKYSVGFAEQAEDKNVAGGRMNRSCPGRSVALLMGSTFLRKFRPTEWAVDPSKEIKIKTGGPYVGDFDMFLKSKLKPCLDNCGSKCPGDGPISRRICESCQAECYTVA